MSSNSGNATVLLSLLLEQCIHDLTASVAIVPHLTASAMMILVLTEIAAQTPTPCASSVVNRHNHAKGDELRGSSTVTNWKNARWVED